MAMSLEIRPLAALYPIIFFFRLIQYKGERPYKPFFCMRGGGYNAAKGLISREITTHSTQYVHTIKCCQKNIENIKFKKVVLIRRKSGFKNVNLLIISTLLNRF